MQCTIHCQVSITAVDLNLWLLTFLVWEQMAKEMCREVVKMIKVLKMNRDMSINEVKLTIVIEDPRARERRESMGIEVNMLPGFSNVADPSHSGFYALML